MNFCFACGSSSVLTVNLCYVCYHDPHHTCYARLDDAPANELSNILVKVRMTSIFLSSKAQFMLNLPHLLKSVHTLCSPVQTFRARLPEVIDQAQHFASINASGGGVGASDGTLAFREGLDGTERERKLSSFVSL